MGLVQWIRKGRRELPYGPYLAMAVLVVMLVADRFIAWLAPGLGAMLGGGVGP